MIVRPHNNRSFRRAGLTLVELLVSLTIVMLVTAWALQQLSPMAESQRTREASRIVSAMLHGAKSKAIETRRPYGVWFDVPRDESDVESDQLLRISTVHLAEVPPIYSGDTADAHARIISGGDSSGGGGGIDQIGTAQLTGVQNPQMIQEGDFIKFNYQDPWYEVVSAGGGECTFRSTYAPLPAADPTGEGRMAFQVLRRPRRARTGRPTNLPRNVVIDLSQSGMQGTEFAGAGLPLVILFSPHGGVERIYAGSQHHLPMSSIYLMIGKGHQVGAENLQDVNSQWVTIGVQTGLVTVHPNRPADSVDGARSVARYQQGLRGQ